MVGFVLCVFVSSVVAQTSNWSPIRRVPGYADNVRPPILVADRNQTVHAFNHQSVDGQISIVYSQWRKASGWTAPVDVISPPRANIARVQGAHLDDTGLLHVVFYSGNEQGAALFYTQSPAGTANLATSWTPPFSIGADAGPLSSADLVGDGQGNLYAVYAGRDEGLGVYATHSNNWGDTWSEPTPVYLTASTDLFPAEITLALDGQNQPHAVWSLVNQQGFGDSIFYATYSSASDTWQPPHNFATWLPEEGQPSSVAPAIYAYQTYLFASYLDINQVEGAVTHTFHTSTDGGNTWSEGQQLFPDYVGTSGRTLFAIDSTDALHMFFAHRTGNPAIHGLWHSRWQNERWQAPVPVLSGFGSNDPPFDPNTPRGVMSQGNTILLTWITDPGVADEGVWYTFTSLDVPELPVEPFVTPMSSPTLPPFIEPTVTIAPTVMPTPAPVFEETATGVAVSPLVWMIVPAGFVVLIFVIYQRFRKK